MEAHPFRFLRNFGRSREIVTVLLNYGFSDVVERLGLMRYLQWGRRVFLRRRTELEPRLTRPQRVRMALEDLGPTFIKFGQIVSTRPDLVPPDFIRELQKLQETVPAFPAATAVKLLEYELELPLAALFAEFDLEPLAAGSLAQVHTARHRDGTRLAVKIRRPNVMHDIERDLSLMRELAVLMERHLPEAQIFDPVGLVNQFARSIRRELNFSREGRTMDDFRKLFRDDATLYVPRVFWDLTTDAALTMEYIDGFRIDDNVHYEQAGVKPADIAANGARIFMKQAFELGLFHGDPHPGNIRVLRDGTICLLDYGMVGTLEEEKREHLVDLFLAISHHDVASAVKLVLVVGRPSRPVDQPLLQSDLRDFIETYYGVELDRINVGKMLTDFVSILSTHGIRYPADLMLLIRAIITLEGVGHNLDPTFNLAQHLAPFVERVVRERYNPRRMASRVLADAQQVLFALHQLPLHVEKTLAKLSSDDLKIQMEHRNLDHLISELDRSGNRIVVGMVMSALIIASALMVRAGVSTQWVTIPISVLWSLLGIWLIFGIFRSGRL